MDKEVGKSTVSKKVSPQKGFYGLDNYGINVLKKSIRLVIVCIVSLVFQYVYGPQNVCDGIYEESW